MEQNSEFFYQQRSRSSSRASTGFPSSAKTRKVLWVFQCCWMTAFSYGGEHHFEEQTRKTTTQSCIRQWRITDRLSLAVNGKSAGRKTTSMDVTSRFYRTNWVCHCGSKSSTGHKVTCTKKKHLHYDLSLPLSALHWEANGCVISYLIPISTTSFQTDSRTRSPIRSCPSVELSIWKAVSVVSALMLCV